MKVILMVSDYNLAANVAVREFLSAKKVRNGDIEVVGILEATTFRIGDKTSWKRAERLLRLSGFRFFMKTSLLNHWQKMFLRWQKYMMADRDRDIFEIKELASQNNIPLLRVDSINDEFSRDFIKKHDPDYLVSALLLQKVSKRVLDLPREGSINFHPALFHQHRGTWSAFSAIFHNFKTWGATVHMMTENFDEGKIILQKRFGIKADESIFSVSQKSAKVGGKLLVKALLRLKYKNKFVTLKKNALAKLSTTPNRNHIKKLKKMNKKMIHTEEVLQLK